jgi:hypothetical protein
MLPTGGALVLASTACAQIAREPRGRVPAEHQPAHIGGQLRVRCRDAATLCGRVEQACAGHRPRRVPVAPDVAASWLCGLALHVAWPPQVLRCGRLAARLELIRRAPPTGWPRSRAWVLRPVLPHLRERLAAGLVVQRLRSGYAVPAGW